MTTTITIIVIIAMLWLAWPRTPKVKIQLGPSVVNLVGIREAIRQNEERLALSLANSANDDPITGHP